MHCTAIHLSVYSIITWGNHPYSTELQGTEKGLILTFALQSAFSKPSNQFCWSHLPKGQIAKRAELDIIALLWGEITTYDHSRCRFRESHPAPLAMALSVFGLYAGQGWMCRIRASLEIDLLVECLYGSLIHHWNYFDSDIIQNQNIARQF